MKKATLISAFLILSSLIHLSAQQSGIIRGTVIDKSTQETIPGAVIEVYKQSDTVNKKFYTSAYKGEINIPGISYGDYTVRVSFLGYKSNEINIKVNRQTVNLGTILMEEESLRIDAVIAEGRAMRTSQKGDTLTYNASAFKVTKDADTEALLSKMPGITVIDGEVEAQGETVKKVFVDGKEFFGQDVNAAIKSLPAEMVDKIEVYNKLSDQAEFTGIDDGEGFKAINIVTAVRSAQFGKLYAGYAPDDKYIAGANVNFFSGKHRFSVISMVNNMNQQNFSMEDILGAVSGGSGRGSSSRGGGYMRGGRGGGGGSFMVRQQDGTSKVESFALNYSGKWGNKMDVTASYFFNKSKNTRESETDRQYIDGSNWLYDAHSYTVTHNSEHRFNARLDYKINDAHNLMMRPSMSFQNYKSVSESFSETWDFTEELGNFINDITRDSYNKNWGYNLSNSLIYRVRLKPGRTITMDVGGRLNKNDRDGDNRNFRRFDLTDPSSDSLFYQRTKTYSDSYSVNGSVMYTESITQYWQLTAQYRTNYSYSDSDKKAYLWDETDEAFDPNFSPEYSSIYNSGYLTHRVGPGFNYNKDKTKISGSVYYQRSSLTSDREYPDIRNVKATFNNVTYFGRLETAFNPTTTLRVFASSSTSNPSITQLQDVVDMSNSQFVTSGNPNLDPSYQHRIYGTFIKSAVTKGRTFMLNGGLSLYNDYISEVIIRQEGYVLPNGEKLERGAQFTQYDNMSGRWQLNGGVSYGFPVKWLGSNINFNLNAIYAETPSIINNEKNKLKEQYYNAGVVIGSNISEKIDFTINYNGGYNIASNTIREDNDNKYLVHYLSLRLKWVAWAGFTFSTTTSFTQNKGITDDYNDKYLLCNVELGKKVFRSQRGELSVFCTDVFDEKTSFRRNVTVNYIENVNNNTLGRYAGVKFVYNLRNYGKRTATPGFGNGNSPDSLHDGPRMRPGGGGPPHGGF